MLLAVSGGPDSMALLVMAAQWARDLGAHAPALHVATVDHGLRPEGGAEAERVAAACARLGLPHATLRWAGEKPRTRIQDRARKARYALLVAHARAIGARHVLTAHHAEDQAETVLMRLARGSGLAGLAGMRRETALAADVILVRPLLDLPKAELVALCASDGVEVVDDPSNRDPAYARARLRAAAPELAALGLDRATLCRLAHRAARADDALEIEVDRTERDCATERADGGCDLRLSSATPIAPEILLRLVGRAVARVAQSDRPLRLARLERLCDQIAESLRHGVAHRATLGGTRVVLGADGALAVTPAPARRRGQPRLRPDRRA